MMERMRGAWKPVFPESKRAFAAATSGECRREKRLHGRARFGFVHLHRRLVTMPMRGHPGGHFHQRSGAHRRRNRRCRLASHVALFEVERKVLKIAPADFAREEIGNLGNVAPASIEKPDQTSVMGNEIVKLTRDTRRFIRYRSEEHTSELQSLMRISYAVFCLKKKKKTHKKQKE